ncbi:tRNA (adenine(58)-N(1))-methyltransferase catalytic subunit TRMT61A-like isoform X1 [Amphibalanus amphitrite]|uniref:tRNA (adenine(58)-N(1))-methyltransferase catalytic subunit TRMT61A-like isoform X1 n=1 Tax=Amphibalanus amphitrite TaxID=1232801 RepID=UPI001C92680A|nr:tRNA (adenine(58)-N(1))-methyltransferase catalytic subunit TRMT61A-like isoform X1 [Amphibalanus amphitrite]XP_043240523.1 tRNA (adenine(58)-N(1))-methyltransferase catalytic subunit TRMT61A-like isoform X1 [Amphibalanus amphitrite]
MSFKEYKTHVEMGDTVILYLNIKNIHAITVSEEVKNKKGNMVPNIFQTVYGALKVKDLVGMKYGSQVQMTRGWAFALHPTPELWTLTLPHRTQILYTPDISMVLTQLELRPGSVVCEAGTGSGSLSHAILRTIAPTGHLHTFDFHEQRSRLAAEEFSAHGVGDYVTARHRDVCGEGFDLDSVADAVFLDLPRPYDAVPFAKQALKKSGGRICSFSPCIEQVQKTCDSLRKHGFTELQTLECLQREFQVRKSVMSVFDLSQQPPTDGSADGDERPSKKAAMEERPREVLTGIPLTTMPGHTGFLTFATLPPVMTSAT